MVLEFNQAGYGRAKNEKELREIIRDYIYHTYSHIEEEKIFWEDSRIDYFARDVITLQPILIEAKNWFVNTQNMMQLIKYIDHATEKYGEDKFKLVIYIGGIRPHRRKILEKLGIEIHLTKDLVT